MPKVNTACKRQRIYRQCLPRSHGVALNKRSINISRMCYLHRYCNDRFGNQLFDIDDFGISRPLFVTIIFDIVLSPAPRSSICRSDLIQSYVPIESATLSP